MLREHILELRKSFLEQADRVETMVSLAIKALKERNSEYIHQVQNEMEPQVNRQEIEIEKTCINILALFQPAAKDLREVLMIFKINNDLERIGDLAAGITRSADFLIKTPEVKPLIDLPKMAEITVQMLKDVIEAFVQRDDQKAQEICLKDDEVDDYQDKIFKDLLQVMMKDNSTVERSQQLLRISKNLERIADLATNIAEDVIYIDEARIIKHGYDKNK